LQVKKIVGENLTNAILADSLAQDLLSLPFWHKSGDFCRFGSLPPCHFGSANLPVWVVQPPIGGRVWFSLPLGG